MKNQKIRLDCAGCPNGIELSLIIGFEKSNRGDYLGSVLNSIIEASPDLAQPCTERTDVEDWVKVQGLYDLQGSDGRPNPRYEYATYATLNIENLKRILGQNPSYFVRPLVII